MKSLLLFGSLLLAGCCFFNSQAQENDWGTGALLNEYLYERTPLAAPITHKSYEQLPNQHSLKPYCPTPGNQYNTATCVGWAVSYGARTIIKSIQNGWNSKVEQEKIDAAAFSPSYLYNQILAEKGEENLPCHYGAYLVEGLRFLRDYGTATMFDFPFSEDCHILPTANQMGVAGNYRIKGYSRLTFSKADNAKVNKVRHSLSNNMPVVAAMKIRKNLKYGDHAKNNYIWNPAEGDTTPDGAHAVLIVSYDDERQVFEIMNSWGTTWGNGGFIYISYAAFNEYVRELYHLIYDPNAPTIKLPESEELLTVSASVGFKQLPTDGLGADGNCVPGVMEEMVVDKEQQMFKMTSPYAAWTGYQIQLTSHVANVNMYAFSFDNSGNTDLLYPFDENILGLYGDSYSRDVKTDALIPYKESIIAIPHEDYCMQLDEQAGTINCFLLSKEALDIHQLLATIEQYPGTLMDRLQGILSNRLLVPTEEQVNWGESGINFKGNVPEHAIIPIVVDMNHIPE